ncbi:MAG: hypothetical protein BM564_03800 [Bacteroidetes bacterium MedPE-SWsnd-G2]|nr:MAG: hypothetical protein BM564_03800 [Bacteroidetes bacterium MedPE-SWsnd-G2]
MRNWYNLYKKRSFRKKNKKLKAKLDSNQLAFSNYDAQINQLESLKENLSTKQTEILQLHDELDNYKKKFYNTLNKKDKEIEVQKETINHQKNAYERYINYKTVEANNTRLGAHFVKNVISQIYEDIEESEINYGSFLGIFYWTNKTKSKLPSLKALKHIFKLLDYNVSALNKNKTSIEEELLHINMFLDLIKFLKPNANVEFKNLLSDNERKQIQIKPTLFFPFVENALKHGSLNKEESFISIELKQAEQNRLSYCLVNSIESMEHCEVSNNKSSQFGLNALQQLLDAYYPNSELEYKTLPNSQYLSQLTISPN